MIAAVEKNVSSASSTATSSRALISDTRSSASSTMLSTELVARMTVRSIRSTSSARDVATVPTWSSSICDWSSTGIAFLRKSSVTSSI